MTSAEPDLAVTPEPKRPLRSFRAKLAAGRFIVSVEVDPPKGLSMKRVIQAARHMQEAGADCVNVGDSPMAEVRMSAMATAAMLKREANLETIVHFSCRDRNIMALQADLLGAHALGLRNIMCIKGDPHALGSYPHAEPVAGINALDLMRIATGFNAGHDAADKPVKPSTRFFVGAAVNPSAQDLKAEARLVKRKAGAGASFLLSQAVFSREAVERLLELMGPSPLPLILGVWPVHSLRQADFLDTHIAAVPVKLRSDLEKAGADAERCGIDAAHRLLEEVRPLVQGVYIIPSFGRFSGIAELVTAARELADGPA